MVCKNCGADLKPGIKYCLECGNYVDDDFDVVSSENGTMTGAGAEGYQLRKVTKKKKKAKLSLVDILIYAGLSLIIIVSLIIIIVNIVRGSKTEVVPEPEVVTGDVTINIDDYQVTIPKALNYDIQGSTLFVSDNKNYTFSYKNTLDNYNTYSNDLNTLSNDLSENDYEVLSIGKRDVYGREFIVCEIRVNGRVKYLYLTKLGTKFTTMGVIDAYEGGVWDMALDVIADINNSIVIDDTYSNTYSNSGGNNNDNTTNSSSSTVESYSEYSSSSSSQNGGNSSSLEESSQSSSNQSSETLPIPGQ